MGEFGLTKEELKAIRQVFSRFPEIEQAIVYGSRAKGNYRANSDIDLTLAGEKLILSRLYEIENELDDLLLPYSIDLSIFSSIENPDLQAHIRRAGQVFYRKNPQTS